MAMLCGNKFSYGWSELINNILRAKPDIDAALTRYYPEEDKYTIAVSQYNGSVFAFMVSNGATHPNRVSASYDIVVEIRRQLPYMLVDKLTIDVCSDPFHLKTKVKFKAGDKEWVCDLEPQREGNRIIACKIPEVFLARLCVEV